MRGRESFRRMLEWFSREKQGEAADLLDSVAFRSETPRVTSGSGAPTSTPDRIGDLYVDTTALKLYFASSSSDWTAT